MAGCTSHSDGISVSGYDSNQIYVTKTDTSAIIVREGAEGKVTDVELNRSSGAGQSAGVAEPIEAGTRIRVENVVRQADVDQGIIVRVTARIESGPYKGAIANLEHASHSVLGPNGKQIDLQADPAVLLRVVE